MAIDSYLRGDNKQQIKYQIALKTEELQNLYPTFKKYLGYSGITPYSRNVVISYFLDEQSRTIMQTCHMTARSSRNELAIRHLRRVVLNINGQTMPIEDPTGKVIVNAIGRQGYDLMRGVSDAKIANKGHEDIVDRKFQSRQFRSTDKKPSF